ncbi:hypothetical protein LINPERHAP2_LOCUS33199 [Linum perenne]
MLEAETLVVNPMFQNKGVEEIWLEIKEDFGPWMTVSRSGRRGKKQVVVNSSLVVPPPAVPSPTTPSPTAENSISGNNFAILSKEEEIQEGEVPTEVEMDVNKEGAVKDLVVGQGAGDSSSPRSESMEIPELCYR